jgi:hypothetical protein
MSLFCKSLDNLDPSLSLDEIVKITGISKKNIIDKYFQNISNIYKNLNIERIITEFISEFKYDISTLNNLYLILINFTYNEINLKKLKFIKIIFFDLILNNLLSVNKFDNYFSINCNIIDITLLYNFNINEVIDYDILIYIYNIYEEHIKKNIIDLINPTIEYLIYYDKKKNINFSHNKFINFITNFYIHLGKKYNNFEFQEHIGNLTYTISNGEYTLCKKCYKFIKISDVPNNLLESQYYLCKMCYYIYRNINKY